LVIIADTVIIARGVLDALRVDKFDVFFHFRGIL
jgi:hypothetical protein